MCTELGRLKPGNRPQLIAAELLNQMQNYNSKGTPKKKEKILCGDPEELINRSNKMPFVITALLGQRTPSRC